MASFVVHERRGVGAADTLFVRDAFTWLGLLFPLPWLLVQRLWFHAGALLLVSVGIGLAAELPRVGATALFLLPLLNLLVALEGPAWRLSDVRRRGYEPVGVVEAKRAAEAEVRWFLRNDGRPAPQTPPPLPHAAPMPRPTGRADLVFGRT